MEIQLNKHRFPGGLNTFVSLMLNFSQTKANQNTKLGKFNYFDMYFKIHSLNYAGRTVTN